MPLILKQNSLALIVFLYLQILASPFDGYHSCRVDCETIQLPSSNNAKDTRIQLARVRREHSRSTTSETIVVTDTMSSGAQTTRRRPTTTRESNQRTTTMGTIVVADPADSASYSSSSSVAASNNITYCDRLARREARRHQDSDEGNSNGGQMFCVDYTNCPSIERETSSTRIRQLTCGLKLDGTIRVCCQDFDRSSLSEEELTGGLVIESDETFNSASIADDVGDEDSADVSHQAAPPRRSTLTGRNQAPGGYSSAQIHDEATVIVNESQALNISMGRSLKSNRENGGRELGLPQQMSGDGLTNGLGTMKRATQQVHDKFPNDCGLAQAGYNDQDELRIIGGKSAKRNAWPWFALLLVQRRRKFEPECGATLITNRHVLTAAHCVLLQGGKRLLPNHQLRVRLGEFNLREPGDGELDFYVDKIVAHKDFNARTFKNDIAIVRLNQNVSQFNESIWPACLAGLDGRHTRLAPHNWNAVDNQTAWVLGFGQTSYNGRTSDQLRQADLRIVPLGKCKRAFAHLVKLNRDYVCASSEYDDPNGADSTKPAGKLKDSCQGDSGGPLMMTMGLNTSAEASDQPGQTPFERWYIYGIVSFGFKCAVPNFAGVYCRVNRYLDWIAANTQF